MWVDCSCTSCSLSIKPRSRSSRGLPEPWGSAGGSTTTDALPCHIHPPVCEWIMDTHGRAPKKNTSHGSEMLPQDTTHLIKRPCYQRGSPCQDPAGNWTTRRSPDDKKRDANCSGMVMFPVYQVWPISSCKAQWKGEDDKADKGRRGRQHEGKDRPGVRQVPEGSGEQGKMEKSGCKIICGAPTTLADKGSMMMIMRSVIYDPSGWTMMMRLCCRLTWRLTGRWRNRWKIKLQNPTVPSIPKGCLFSLSCCVDRLVCLCATQCILVHRTIM